MENRYKQLKAIIFNPSDFALLLRSSIMVGFGIYEDDGGCQWVTCKDGERTKVVRSSLGVVGWGCVKERPAG
jgi:hypothetical protein